jgi:hypothetical protein
MPGVGVGTTGLAVAALLLAVGVPLVLYRLVRAEHDRQETMDRREAERVVRRDTRDRD